MADRDAGEMLAMNPFVEIHVHPQPEAYPIDIARIATITVRCPVRGRGLQIRELTRAGDPAVFGFFAELVARGGELSLDSDAALVPALVDLGLLVVERDVVDWPQFSVPLEIGPSRGAAPPEGQRVATSFLFQPAFALHPCVRWPRDYDDQDGRRRCFASGPAFWVGDPAGIASPYWVTRETAAVLARLTPGAAPPPLPPDLQRALAAVGALVPVSGAAGASPADAAPSSLARFVEHRAGFTAAGHAIVRDLLGAAELAGLRRYYAALLAAGLVPLGDRQHAARYSAYNDPVGRFVHARLAAAMSAVVGRPVVPSFSYLFSYIAGAALEPHKDRAQAEFSISLQIDHDPAPEATTGWPLWFSFDDGRCIAADLRIGDAVLYHGRAVRHHRAALPAGQRSTVLVLEYVPPDFAGLRI